MRTRTSSDWTTTLDDGQEIKTRVSHYGDERVYVTVSFPDGIMVERYGRMTIERTILPPARIVEVTVSSINGDIKAHDRTKIGAAEEYGSRVAQVVAQQWKAGTL